VEGWDGWLRRVKGLNKADRSGGLTAQGLIAGSIAEATASSTAACALATAAAATATTATASASPAASAPLPGSSRLAAVTAARLHLAGEGLLGTLV
jgi:hypothetical protein